MKAPPPSKKRTIGYIISITGSSRTWRAVHLWYSFRARVRARGRSDLVVLELPLEDVPVHGLAARIERTRDVERVAGLRALPGHDHERLGRVVVAQDRDARQLLLARLGGLLGGLLSRGRTGQQEEGHAGEESAEHRVYLPVRVRRSASHMRAASSSG